jgi:hypothetical protein
MAGSLLVQVEKFIPAIPIILLKLFKERASPFKAKQQH